MGAARRTHARIVLQEQLVALEWWCLRCQVGAKGVTVLEKVLNDSAGDALLVLGVGIMNDKLPARSGLDTLLTKGDGGRDGVFGFPERALAGLGRVNLRSDPF